MSVRKESGAIVVIEKSPTQKMFKTFLTGAIPVAVLVTLFLNWQVGILFGALAGIFFSMHTARSLTTETFEINSTNKDPLKGLSWYENEIVSHMHDLRYRIKVDQKELKIWQPRTISQNMGGDFKMEVTPYSITIEGPRGMVRIVKSVLDLEKIFL